MPSLFVNQALEAVKKIRHPHRKICEYDIMFCFEVNTLELIVFYTIYSTKLDNLSYASMKSSLNSCTTSLAEIV